MFAKLFKGELSLGATFWKFGVLMLIILHYALKKKSKTSTVLSIPGRTYPRTGCIVIFPPFQISESII